MTSTSTRTKPLIALAFLAASAALWWPLEAQAVRLKEIAAVQGVRTNQLTGYGLVVGLDGTGDQTTQTPFTTQSVQAMLQQIHLWQHDHFLIGIDATLHYWQLAGHSWLVAFLRLPPCYWLAKKAYAYWAAKRTNCINGDCTL